MTKKDLLKQLHNLQQEIKPDLEWKRTSRDILFSQIKAQTQSDLVVKNSSLSFIRAFAFIYKPALSFVVIVLIVFGAWIASVSATKNSLPGDFLYKVKLTGERVQVNLTFNDEKRTNLEIAFAERRLDEFKKTVEKNKDTKTKLPKESEITLKKFEESINNIKSNLNKLEITDKETAIKLANLVDTKTTEYVGLIKDQQGDISGDLAVNATDAITASKSTGDKAVEVIIEQFENGGGDDVSLEEVKDKLRKRVEALEVNIDQSKINIDKIIKNQEIEVVKKKAEAEAEAERLKAEAEAEAERVKAEAEAAKNQPVVTEEPKEEGSGEAATQPSTEPVVTNTNESPATNTSVEPVVTQPDADKSTETVPADDQEETSTEPVEVLPTVLEIKNKPSEAAVFLTAAKDFLTSNSVSQAFDQIKQADEILTLVNKVIEANAQYLIEQIIENNNSDISTSNSTIEDNPSAIKEE